MTRVSRTWLTAGISVVQLFHNTDDIVAANIDILSMESIHYLDRGMFDVCLLYTSPSPRDKRQSRMPSSA